MSTDGNLTALENASQAGTTGAASAQSERSGGRQNAKPTPVVSDQKESSASNLEARLAALEAGEKALKEKQAELLEMQEKMRAAEDSDRLRPVRPSEAVCVGNGYLFVVTGKKDSDGLPRKEIRCCDESEALRWYVATTPNPKNPTKQVDPVTFHLDVKCMDATRNEHRQRDLRLSVLRAKSDRGVPLTPEEQQTLEEWDLERLGII
jgi:hypothetical protein